MQVSFVNNNLSIYYAGICANFIPLNKKQGLLVSVNTVRYAKLICVNAVLVIIDVCPSLICNATRNL